MMIPEHAHRWIEEILGDEQEFSRFSVTILMQLAYHLAQTEAKLEAALKE